MTISGFEIYPPILLLGLVVGLAYGLLGVGLIVVHRTSRVLNLAHAQIGVFAAVVLAFLVVSWGVPYWLALIGALVVGALTAVAAELAAVRRLASAPPVMSFVATLGIAQVLTFLSLYLYAQVQVGPAFPQPPGVPAVRVGALLVTPAFSVLLVAGPAAALGLVLFFRSSLGRAVRAAADRPALARLTAISPARMSLIAWGTAGSLSALTAALIIPVLAPVTPDLSGPALLLRALAAAVVARMSRVGVAMATGVVLGLVDQLAYWNDPRGSVEDLVVAAVVCGALLTLRPYRVREQEADPRWRKVQAWRPALPGSPAAARLRVASACAGAAALAVAAGCVALLPSDAAVTVSVVAAYAVVGMSVLFVTGLLGELSLAQFALAAVGGVASIRITYATGNFFLGFSCAALVGAAAAVAVGIPAMRLGRIALPVTTLAFAVAAHGWLLPQPWALGTGLDPGRPVLGELRFDTFRAYAFLTLGVLAVATVATAHLAGAGTRRRFVAVRDDPTAARAFGLDPGRVILQGMGLAGALAGIGGALYVHLFPALAPRDLPLHASISAVAIAAIGGLSWAAGPLVGALWVVGVPRLVGIGDLVLATTAFGWLVLVLYVPGGIAQLVAPLRAAVVGSRSTLPPRAAAVVVVQPAPPASASLEIQGIRHAYGGVVALDDVRLRVAPGETVALVGPNGAGKSTLLDVVGGFTSADAGRVLLDDADVTGFAPQRLARLGVIRSFQRSRLFATLTVLEVVALALERLSPSSPTQELLGLRRGYRRNLAQAAEVTERTGLSPYDDRYVHELSTGMRRITDLACVIALRPRLLLLDEPSSGVAQAELPHLVALLREVTATTGASLLLVEHNTRLVRELADRAVGLHLGRVVAVGTPAEVLGDDAFAARYLG